MGMMTASPADMPAKGSPLTLVNRERTTVCDASYDGYVCCYDWHTEKVPAIKRGPKKIKSPAMADALREAGL